MPVDLGEGHGTPRLPEHGDEHVVVSAVRKAECGRHVADFSLEVPKGAGDLLACLFGRQAGEHGMRAGVGAE